MSQLSPQDDLPLPDLPALEAAEQSAKLVFDGLRKKARAVHYTPSSYKKFTIMELRDINRGITEYVDLCSKITAAKKALLSTTSEADLIAQFKILYEQLQQPLTHKD